MKYRITAFCLFVLAPLFIFGQGPFSYDIELELVNFQNGYPMKTDDNLGNYVNVNEYELIGGGVYATAPVAYMAGNSFLVEANFQTSCPISLFIRGKHIRPGGEELIFPAHEITPDGTGQLHYTFDQPTENGSIFSFPAGIIEFHDPFEIVWQFSMTDSGNDADWIDIHTSANPVYVYRTFPNFSFQEKKFHTFFRASCRAADGQSDDDAIIAAVWAMFETLNSFVRADDNETLAYYGDWTNAKFHSDSLIITGNGQCSAYSMAFLNCLKVQGINQADDYLFVTAELPQSSEEFGLLVNNFESTATGPFTHWVNDIPPNVPTGFTINNVVVPNQVDNPYNFTNSVFADNVLYSEIEDLDGTQGQSESNPKPVFVNHQIISLVVGGDTILYDVPYGLTYNSLDQMRDNIFGYIYETIGYIDETSLGFDLDGSGTIDNNVEFEVWLIDTNPLALELDGEALNNF